MTSDRCCRALTGHLQVVRGEFAPGFDLTRDGAFAA